MVGVRSMLVWVRPGSSQVRVKTCWGQVSFMMFVCLFIAVDEAAPYGVSEQTGLPRLLKTKPQEGSLKATDGGGQGPRRFPITASGGTIGGASP